MLQTCKNCNQNFEITDNDLKFYDKMSVPIPKFCPECRWQRRFAYRNEWGLHRRKCGGCNKKLISMLSSEDFTAYCEKCWWKDDFDPCRYGQDFDFTRPFFEQIGELLHRIPLPHLIIGECENSDYTSFAWKLKIHIWFPLLITAKIVCMALICLDPKIAWIALE